MTTTDIAQHSLFHQQVMDKDNRCTKSLWGYNHQQHIFEDSDMNKHHITNMTLLELVHAE
jgi:hypothetical protein